MNIASVLNSHIEVIKSLEAEIPLIQKISEICYNAVINGNKILFCGNGGSAADAQHLAAEFVGRFVTKRRSLPAIALTTDTSILTAVANDFGFENIFSRQIDGLGISGDVLIAMSTSGNSANIINATNTAKQKGIIAIGFLGYDGGKMKDICDYSFIVKVHNTARVQEAHLLTGHIICEYIDENIV
jgi:D-sedoheptulose 7-phosphate isomerase